MPRTGIDRVHGKSVLLTVLAFRHDLIFTTPATIAIAASAPATAAAGFTVLTLTRTLLHGGIASALNPVGLNGGPFDLTVGTVHALWTFRALRPFPSFGTLRALRAFTAFWTITALMSRTAATFGAIATLPLGPRGTIRTIVTPRAF